jgi:hypothetical protein
VTTYLDRLNDASLSLFRTLLYIDSLACEIPEEVFWIIEDAHAKSRHDKGELMVPYEYAQEVEKERLLRATLKNIRVSHLPPRYLDPEQKAPWGKRRLGDGADGAQYRETFSSPGVPVTR